MRLRLWTWTGTCSRVSHTVFSEPICQINFANKRHFQCSASSKKGSQSHRKSPLEHYFPNVQPAALPYHVGTDICHTPRISKLLYEGFKSPSAERKGTSRPTVNTRFLERLFNDKELEYIHEKWLKFSHQIQRKAFANFVSGR